MSLYKWAHSLKFENVHFMQNIGKHWFMAQDRYSIVKQKKKSGDVINKEEGKEKKAFSNVRKVRSPNTPTCFCFLWRQPAGGGGGGLKCFLLSLHLWNKASTELWSLQRKIQETSLSRRRGWPRGVPALFGVQDLAEASAKTISRTKALITIAPPNLAFADGQTQVTKWLRSFPSLGLDRSRSETHEQTVKIKGKNKAAHTLLEELFKGGQGCFPQFLIIFPCLHRKHKVRLIPLGVSVTQEVAHVPNCLILSGLWMLPLRCSPNLQPQS